MARRSYSSDNCSVGCTHIRTGKTVALPVARFYKQESIVSWPASAMIFEASHINILPSASPVGLSRVEAEPQWLILTTSQAIAAFIYNNPSWISPGEWLEPSIRLPWKQTAAESSLKLVRWLSFWLGLAEADLAPLSWCPPQPIQHNSFKFQHVIEAKSYILLLDMTWNSLWSVFTIEERYHWFAEQPKSFWR